jgi:hypothetical protein
MSPSKSDDLTEIVEERAGKFVALKSPDNAEHAPDYVEVAILCDAPAAGRRTADR